MREHTLRVGIGRAAALALASAVLGASPSSATEPAYVAACAPEQGGTHRVAAVLDGETLRLDDGGEVRLIGALAPRPPDGHAARRALADLVDGRSVLLRYADRKRDRYGRALAQVVVAQTDAAGAPGSGIWVQQSLVRAGLARAYALPGNVACLRSLMAAEAEARAANAGHWGIGAFTVRQAADVAILGRRTGLFEIVEGEVHRAARTRDLTYINFGSDWRRDFTAAIATGQVDRAKALERIKALAGRKIRVRGWIERRNGPMIVLGALDEIEVLAPDGTAQPLMAPEAAASVAPPK